MFTGIITAIGTISEITEYDKDKTFLINAGSMPLSDLNIGDSVCINGVCLTVTKSSNDSILVDVSAETLECTNFSQYNIGSRVNLEKAMLSDMRFNGHLVSGHVDCVASIGSIDKDGRSIRYEIILPDAYMKYVCKKGSICVDGVSLTVNEKDASNINVNIIPHTLSSTIFSDYVTGSLVNIEVDVIARYLEALVKPYQ